MPDILIAPKISYRGAFATIPLSRTVIFVAARLLVLLAISAPLPAAARQHVFTIESVAVDATARTAAAARELALADGHAKAFERLMARLVPRTQLTQVPPQSAGAIAALVSNFEVAEEKTSAVRYLAKLTFRFKRRAVRRLLKVADISYAESRSKPALVLPVYRSAGVNLLWDKPNPWLESWSTLPLSDGLMPMIVPAGDLSDIAAISAEQAVEGRLDRLRAMSRRYRTASVIVVQGAISMHPFDNAPVLQVTLTRFGTSGKGQEIVRNFTGIPGTSVEELIAFAAQATEERIQEDWKTENLLRFDRQSEIIVIVPLRELADWVATERALAGVALVQSSALVSLSRRKATVRLNYLGDRNRLKQALAQRDLSLEEGPGIWVLRPAAGDHRDAAR